MGLFDFFRHGKKPSESDVFQMAFEEAFKPLDLPFLKKAKLLVTLYDAFKAGVADNGAKQAATITGLSKKELKPLLDRTWRLTHSRLQWQRIQESAEALPYLMLDVPEKLKAKPECVAMDGCARRVDDPYWASRFPPCERVGCLCRVIQMGDRQIERHGVTVIPPGAP